MKQCLTLISLLPLAVDVSKTPGGLDVVKEGVGRQLMSPRGRRDDVDEMVSNKCIHKKINHYLLTLLLLNIVVEGTTEMCVQIVC
jgi:hypothetical protein